MEQTEDSMPDIPHEWPDARPVIGRKLMELHDGIRTVDNRLTDQGERHDVQMAAMRQSLQQISDTQRKDIERQGRHHDEIRGALQAESMRADIRLIILCLLVLSFLVPFFYWLATK